MNHGQWLFSVCFIVSCLALWLLSFDQVQICLNQKGMISNKSTRLWQTWRTVCRLHNPSWPIFARVFFLFSCSVIYSSIGLSRDLNLLLSELPVKSCFSALFICLQNFSANEEKTWLLSDKKAGAIDKVTTFENVVVPTCEKVVSLLSLAT